MSNNTSDQTEIFYTNTEMRLADVLLATATAVFSLPGLPGNLMVMFLTLSRKEIRSETYTWLLFNLALVDFCFCFQCCFLQTIFIVRHESIGCKITGFMEYFTGTTSFFFPAFVALNRYTKVVHGQGVYQKWFSKRNMALLNLFPWLWSATVLSPFLVGGWVGKEPLGVCGVQNSANTVLSIYFIVVVGVPISVTYSVVVFCYLRFRQHLLSHAQNAGYLQSPVIKESRSIMWATRLICIIPLIAQGPTVLNKVLLVPFGFFDTMPWIPVVCVAFFPLTSACNPYVTLLVVKPYKAAIRKMWIRLTNINSTAAVHPGPSRGGTLHSRNTTTAAYIRNRSRGLPKTKHTVNSSL